jgi:hypothetical protein
MADPRVVTGFKPLTKEIVYPLVVENQVATAYGISMVMSTSMLSMVLALFLVINLTFIKEALHKQIENGFEVGPQHPLAAEVCELLCEFTQQERAALCNTGSEAVLEQCELLER